MKAKNVPIPARMAHLEKDRRGYPIPANVLRDIKGEPAFTVNNAEWVLTNQIESEVCACGICGLPLEVGDMHFIGGPASAFHPQGVYLDGPVHEECGTYALEVCPYLAMPNYTKRLDGKAAKNPLPVDATVDWTQYEGRPTCFVMGRATSFSVTRSSNVHLRRFVPCGIVGAPIPVAEKFVSVQVWKDGMPVDDEKEMTDLVRAGLEAVEAAPPANPRMCRAKPKPGKAPCGTCPYRKDVPSGLWDASEYVKLPEYDLPLLEQAEKENTALFYCHQQDGNLCAGWVGCHDMTQTLAALVRDVDESVFHYESPVPLFSSGKEACEHGMRDIENVGPEGRKAIDKLIRQKANRKLQRVADGD